MGTNQNNVVDYAKAIQAELVSILSPLPVYASFNRNWSREQQFVTWQLRNVHQEVYTGIYQNNKGIDRPVFQISVFTTDSGDAFNIANTIIQSLHGYSGQFGGVGGFYVSKCDVVLLYHAYNDENDMYNIFMDCTMDIPS